MTEKRPEGLYRLLPKMDRLLEEAEVKPFLEQFDVAYVTSILRDFLESVRIKIREQGLSEEEVRAAIGEVESFLRERTLQDSTLSLRPVINATGVILHTNLGRAPVDPQALEALNRLATGYMDLEYDRREGTRSSRDRYVVPLLRRLFSAPAAAVVNNNAAAVLLVLNTISQNKEVVISRGELVEIGGSFRLPEIIKRTGAKLREVGTTNKTRIADYREAVGTATGAILKVHPSNYTISGYTEETSMEDLVELGRDAGVPVVYDLGSASSMPLSPPLQTEEPSVSSLLELGLDAITFSGDKILGGPQAGVLLGRSDLVKSCRDSAFYRALRVDKITLVLLESTLQKYLRGEGEDIPMNRLLFTSAEEIGDRAAKFVEQIGPVLAHAAEIEICDGKSVVGGGSKPGMSVPTRLIAVRPHHVSPDEVTRRLRMHRPPIIARIAQDQVMIDLRTVVPGEEQAVASALHKMLGPSRA